MLGCSTWGEGSMCFPVPLPLRKHVQSMEQHQGGPCCKQTRCIPSLPWGESPHLRPRTLCPHTSFLRQTWKCVRFLHFPKPEVQAGAQEASGLETSQQSPEEQRMNSVLRSRTDHIMHRFFFFFGVSFKFPLITKTQGACKSQSI